MVMKCNSAVKNFKQITQNSFDFNLNTTPPGANSSLKELTPSWKRFIACVNASLLNGNQYIVENFVVT